MKILIVHGPNLNLLGERNPKQYGTESLTDLNSHIRENYGKDHTLKFFQSNSEGAIVDCLHEERYWADSIVINPGALTHYSYVLRDAIEAVELPCVEVHLSDIANREEFRKISVITPVCIGQVKGKGFDSYVEGIQMLMEHTQ
ncbi:MAG: 3-dehydroquinate dehydratase [Candidatus Marinimicrobia bacterium]|nr:3-dehydroquinate dehydratase [Candidatus Neomarinimicrobiota bacterium]